MVKVGLQCFSQRVRYWRSFARFNPFGAPALCHDWLAPGIKRKGISSPDICRSVSTGCNKAKRPFRFMPFPCESACGQLSILGPCKGFNHKRDLRFVCEHRWALEAVRFSAFAMFCIVFAITVVGAVALAPCPPAPPGATTGISILCLQRGLSAYLGPGSSAAQFLNPTKPNLWFLAAKFHSDVRVAGCRVADLYCRRSSGKLIVAFPQFSWASRLAIALPFSARLSSSPPLSLCSANSWKGLVEPMKMGWSILVARGPNSVEKIAVNILVYNYVQHLENVSKKSLQRSLDQSTSLHESLRETSWQDFSERFLCMITWQDLYIRSPDKPVFLCKYYKASA